MLYIFDIFINQSVYYIGIIKMFSNIEFFLKSKTSMYLYKVKKRKEKRGEEFFLVHSCTLVMFLAISVPNILSLTVFRRLFLI